MPGLAQRLDQLPAVGDPLRLALRDEQEGEVIAVGAGKRNDETITIDAAYVDMRLKELALSEDLARYVL